MHYNEIWTQNILEGRRLSRDDGALKLKVEYFTHVDGRIVEPIYLKGGRDPILVWGHEYRDHQNGGRYAVIYQG